VEIWELFYIGDRSFVALQAEIALLKSERDSLLADNAVLKDKVDHLKDKVDSLKDDLIATLKQKNI
jgi:cell division protein FtsB